MIGCQYSIRLVSRAKRAQRVKLLDRNCISLNRRVDYGKGAVLLSSESRKRTHPKGLIPSRLVRAGSDQTELGGLHPHFLAKAVDLVVDLTSDEQEEAGEV